MTVTFPIPVDLNQFLFGSMLAQVHQHPEMIQPLLQAGLVPAASSDMNELATDVQRHLYHSTLNDLLAPRTRMGSDLYAPAWFLLGFHGWVAIAASWGVPNPPWIADVDHALILKDVIFELGVDTDIESIRSRLREGAEDHPDFEAVRTLLFYFAEQVTYLSSAAIRRGHRVGLEVPAASVFISHAHENRDFVNGLVDFLEEHAVDVWLDSSDLKSGSGLDSRLREAIQRQERFVVILSEAALASDYVAYEIAAAIELGKGLIPVRMVPMEDLAAIRNPTDGSSLYEALMKSPIEDATEGGWIQAYENVLRSLQKTDLDLTRWRQDEGSHLAAVFGRFGKGKNGPGL